MTGRSRTAVDPTRTAPILSATSAAYEVVEPQIRRLVADHLGVGLDILVAHVSLRDDLAVDSLDLVDLILAIEARFMIAVPQHTLDAVHSYDDLVRESIDLIRAGRSTVNGQLRVA
jgi:acyl carrier protein